VSVKTLGAANPRVEVSKEARVKHVAENNVMRKLGFSAASEAVPYPNPFVR
jgi:hypothetical protein